MEVLERDAEISGDEPPETRVCRGQDDAKTGDQGG
jgi:hypothetical protein